jgi:hypothetical protein
LLYASCEKTKKNVEVGTLTGATEPARALVCALLRPNMTAMIEPESFIVNLIDEPDITGVAIKIETLYFS